MTDHGPIVVHNDTDLADLMALNDWPGDGSSANPFLISNLAKNATGDSNAISIGNTSSYLIIANSHLSNTSLLSVGFGEGTGIFLFNSSHVLIVNNSINDCRYGILVRNSTVATAYNNTISQCSSFGLMSSGSSGGLFYLNAFVGNNNAASTYDPNYLQAFDDGSSNAWSSATLGNYWSDLRQTMMITTAFSIHPISLPA